MKTIGLLVALLGVVSGAIYVVNNFTILKNRFLNPGKTGVNNKVNTKTGKTGTITDHAKSSISQSYAYATADREY